MSSVAQSMEGRSKVHPHKFALWVAFASITMMFTAFTSAYIVRQAAGNWLEFKLPSVFFVSTAAIVLSSVTLHAAYWAYKKQKTSLYRSLMVGTLLLGTAFLFLQYEGWLAMNEIGAGLTSNPSSSFVYVISGIHAVHIMGGMIALLMSTLTAIRMPNTITPKRTLRFELVLNYWHFVDFLWVYLLIFFLIQQ